MYSCSCLCVYVPGDEVLQCEVERVCRLHHVKYLILYRQQHLQYHRSPTYKPLVTTNQHNLSSHHYYTTLYGFAHEFKGRPVMHSVGGGESGVCGQSRAPLYPRNSLARVHGSSSGPVWPAASQGE